MEDIEKDPFQSDREQRLINNVIRRDCRPTDIRAWMEGTKVHIGFLRFEGDRVLEKFIFRMTDEQAAQLMEDIGKALPQKGE